MKKSCLIVVLLCVFSFIYGQEHKHLTFKGIPIDGNFNNFEKELKNVGFDNTFTLSSKSFTGKFAGEDCTLIVFCTPKTNTVFQVIVIFKGTTTWSIIKHKYFQLKELYKSKYGNPRNVKEYFISPYYESDGYELAAIMDEKCWYQSNFLTYEGSMLLIIDDFITLGDGCVAIIYRDAKNARLYDDEKNINSLSDI